MDCSIPGFSAHHQLLELAQTHVIQSVMPANHLILCCSLHLLPLIFPSISIFSNESFLHQVAKELELKLQHESSNEYSGLISFRIDWFDLLEDQGTLKSLLQNYIS